MKMKSSKHFRILSVLLSCLMLSSMVTFATGADETTVTASITSHKNGDIIEGGSNVVLTAECNDATLSRIDLYANGNKLPGNISASGESLIWQSPAAGTYTLKAVAINSNNAETHSAEVTVYVKAADVISSFYSTADLDGWHANETPFTDFENYVENSVTTDNAAIGAYSYRLNNPPSWFIKYKTPFLCADRKYINMPVFIEGIPESKDGNILVNMAVQSAGGNQTTRVNLKNGWQILSQEILAKAKGTNITTVAFGFAGSGDTTLTAEEKKSVNMYVNGLYYSDDNTLTASPVIPDGQANVCNGLTTYRIKFNKPLAFDLTSDELADSVSITYGTDGSISDLSVVPGTDYIDVIISADSLSTDGTEYTVTVAANKVRDCYGAYYAGGPFTFSTIGNGCTTATPVPFVTYPKAGSLNATDAALAASVIFNANVSKVEFFEIAADGTTETSLGEATKATNEWVLSPATAWSTGSHTVYAKVTTTAAENNVFSSEAVTFTVAEKTDYRLVGIEDGDTVVVNENLGTTVSVIDDNTDTFTVRDGKGNGGGHADGTVTYNDPDATASNVDRVIYYLNNEKVAEVNAAPYSTDLDIVKLGQNSNTLKVEIYDQLGCLTTISKTFNAAYGYVQNGYDEDFDGTNPVIPENMINLHPDAEPTSGTDYWKQEVTTFGESKALSIYGGNNYEHWVAMGLWPVALDVSSGLNRVFLEFDYSVNQYSGNLPALCLREDSTIGNNNKANSAPYAVINLPIDELKSSNKSFKTTRLGFDISWNDATQQITYKVYLNNLECYRRTTLYSYKQKIDPTNLIAVLNLDRDTVWQWYIDNIHVAAYSIPDDVSVFANGKQEREYDEAGNAEITVANISADTDATVMNFVAVYDSSDRLVSITPYEIDLDAKTLSDETYPVSLAAGQYAKIFTWFDGTLKPVTLK